MNHGHLADLLGIIQWVIPVRFLLTTNLKMCEYMQVITPFYTIYKKKTVLVSWLNLALGRSF